MHGEETCRALSLIANEVTESRDDAGGISAKRNVLRTQRGRVARRVAKITDAIEERAVHTRTEANCARVCCIATIINARSPSVTLTRAACGISCRLSNCAKFHTTREENRGDFETRLFSYSRRGRSGQFLPRRGYSQVSMSAPASFPEGPK